MDPIPIISKVAAKIDPINNIIIKGKCFFSTNNLRLLIIILVNIYKDIVIYILCSNFEQYLLYCSFFELYDVFMDDKQDHFNILRKLDKKSKYTQRDLASELGFSLGKLNYCLKELKKKGLIKLKNFKKNNKKINYIYILTPSGISTKTKLTLNFMQRKMREYEELKKELNADEK